MAELMRELIAAQANPVVDDVLFELGITDAHIGRHCGAKLIRTHGDFYEPDDDGFFALVIPVLEDGELADLLAFNPLQPDNWWLRLGACRFLGSDNIFCQSAPIHIWRTPLRWLNAGLEGVVVLDWSGALPTLRPLAEVVTEDTDHGQEIRRHLQQPLPIPDIRVLESTVGRAV